MTVCAIILFLLSIVTAGGAADLEPFRDLPLNDAAALQEATRVLEEEVRLAARPHTYLLIDLVERTIHVKARGVELHRMSIERWSMRAGRAMTGVFRIVERPPVVRRKIDPAATVEQEPISLADMPVHYALSCTPSLTLEVFPPADENLWQWILSHGHSWWRQLAQWGNRLSGQQNSPSTPHLRLTLSAEHARSFAWSMVDGMSLIIRRPDAL